jgi:hydroxymethylpyrimidine pyrophosphatase-like HAD family hydrolase
LTKGDLSRIRLIVFDVDGVLVPQGTTIKQDGNRFYMDIKTIGKEEIKLMKILYDMKYRLVINSGRSLYVLLEMFHEVTPFVSFIYENGSATWDQGKVTQLVNPFIDIVKIQDILRKIKDKKIKGWEPKEFLITIHCTDRIKQIEEAMKYHSRYYCLWNGEAYDIGNKTEQNKGIGLIRYRMRHKYRKEEVLGIGDNVNDVEFLDVCGISVTADKSRVEGNFYIDRKDKLPANILMKQIVEVRK